MMELMRKAMLKKVESTTNKNQNLPSILPSLSPTKSAKPSYDNPLASNPNNKEHANTVVKPKFDLMAIMQ